MTTKKFAVLATLVLATVPVFAEAPPAHIPPPGVVLTDTDRAELTTGAATLRGEIDALTPGLAGDANLLARLPDVEIFHKAVDWALRYNEFFISFY